VPEVVRVRRLAVEESDYRRRPLLRACFARPRRRAAEQRDELAALQTSSARASSVGGMSRPSAFAVLRFITNSNFVGSWIGKSSGFSPLSMRAAYQASWQKEIFSVDLFFSKARFFEFLLNSNRKALAISISDNLLSLAAHRETFEFVGFSSLSGCAAASLRPPMPIWRERARGEKDERARWSVRHCGKFPNAPVVPWCHLSEKSACFSMRPGSAYWCHFSAKSLAISTNGTIQNDPGLLQGPRGASGTSLRCCKLA
jgi:hypothetical protein